MKGTKGVLTVFWGTYLDTYVHTVKIWLGWTFMSFPFFCVYTMTESHFKNYSIGISNSGFDLVFHPKLLNLPPKTTRKLDKIWSSCFQKMDNHFFFLLKEGKQMKLSVWSYLHSSRKESLDCSVWKGNPTKVQWFCWIEETEIRAQ